MSRAGWRPPVRVGDAVAATLEKLGLEAGVRQHEVWQIWASVVGAQIALHAQPHSFSRGRLLVHVTDPVWLHHLRMMRHDVLAALNRKLHPIEIKEFVLRIGEFPAIMPETSPTPVSVRAQELTESERAAIEAALAPFGDAPFREALQRLWTRAAREAKARTPSKRPLRQKRHNPL